MFSTAKGEPQIRPRRHSEPSQQFNPSNIVSIIIYLELDNFFSLAPQPGFSGQNNSIIFHYRSTEINCGGWKPSRLFSCRKMSHSIVSFPFIAPGSLIYWILLTSRFSFACLQFPGKTFDSVLRAFFFPLLYITKEHEKQISLPFYAQWHLIKFRTQSRVVVCRLIYAH